LDQGNEKQIRLSGIIVSMKYVAVIHSQLHLNALYAYIKMNNICSEDEIEVYLQEEPDGSTLISEEDFFFPCKYTVSRKKEQLKKLKKISKSINRITYFYLLKICSKKGTHINCIYPDNSTIYVKDLYRFQKASRADCLKLVIIEEGIGMYIRDEKRWLERGIESASGIKKTVYKILSPIWFKYSTKKILEMYSKNGNLQRYNLFLDTKDGLVPNKDYCKAFASVFSERAERYCNCVDYSNTIIINSQPMFEELKIDDDIECYKRIKEICNIKNIRLIIKPHPREKHLERYLGFEVDTENRGISQEILIAKSNTKPLAIIGLFSTTLVTGNIFYDIPAICVGKIIDRGKLVGFGNDIDNFINAFHNTINVPENYEDINVLIEQLRKIY